MVEILRRPDSDVITGPDGKRMTVGDIRKVVKQREQRIAELKSGKAQKTFAPADQRTVYSPRRAQLLQRHAQVRDQENRIASKAREAELLALQNSRGASTPVLTGPTSTMAAKSKPFAPPRDRTVAREVANYKGIVQVNKSLVGFRTAPGAFLTITGVGFGEKQGSVRIINLQGSATAAIEAAIHVWTDGLIYAQLPPNIRGVPDQENATIQVLPTSGAVYSADGGKFIAAREETSLISSGLDRLITVKLGSWNTLGVDSFGIVERHFYGEKATCPEPGQDEILPKGLRKDFEITGVVLHYGRHDSGDGDEDGNAGSHNFFGNYSVRWQGDRLIVTWGVFRSHSSPFGVVAGLDQCRSLYQVAISVTGPAGVPPI